MKTALTIAGSDSSGGAGIQADLKTFLSFGLHGASAVTSLTAQNTRGVHSQTPVAAECVGRQIEAVLADMGAAALKTGALVNSEIVSVVCSAVREFSVPFVVVDPVIFPKSGPPLLDGEGVSSLLNTLLPLATIVTPNIPEAELLSGEKISGVDDMKRAAEKIGKKGAAVLVTGGHLDTDDDKVVDVLWFRGKIYYFEAERIDEKNTHGTGCVLSASLAASLAMGAEIPEAVKVAKKFVTKAIKTAYKVGSGTGPVNPCSSLLRDSERYRLLIKTEKAFEILRRARIAPLIPEIQSNLASALAGARNTGDVIGFPNRIIRRGQGADFIGRPVFGGSGHVARIVLAVMNFDPEMRSCMNLRYSSEIIEACGKNNLLITSFSRKDEPEEIQKKEGSSLEWGVEMAIKALGKVPDIIFDRGGDGKEPVTRVIGRSPEEVADKVVSIRRAL